MSQTQFELHNYRFQTNIGAGTDYWGLCGKVTNRDGFDPDREVFVSTPIAFDRATATIRTFSGSEYRLVNPGDERERVFRDIEKCVASGGYETW